MIERQRDTQIEIPPGLLLLHKKQNMEYAVYDDRYILKLCFHLPPNHDHPGTSSSTGLSQRVYALVTNMRPDETLSLEKLHCIAGRIPALHQRLRGPHVYVPPADRPSLKMIKAPYQPSPGDHPVKEAWKAYTGSRCPVFKLDSQATVYRPQVAMQKQRPQMMPPVALEVPWHPEEAEERNADLGPTTLYSAQVSADGQKFYEVFTPIEHSGGEKIPGLWRFSAYNQDNTLYFSVVVNVTEERDMPKKPSNRKRKADDNGQHDDQSPSRKRANIP
ncbi:hypothetical protein AALO_G00102410 [Alosa alosa]|uniref:Uncharacterized protein n=1 Tax=Alosa alosa TaxID=278164 RepID=A0AAV6GUE6_9TELE|nr:uncharacterized protein LOC125297508 [Alosa alosa]KAG5278758.1 hypothetical protein AALO_G00102410 [Alosa alosa]